ncbi:hypothetical protein PCANC_17629 [Puccinia coronata f. sp. avenae]|uniref:Uncharacterized protein n=1 Tax=Puccinia coronata f. sp. avenae TaxID=200324 RepID=A0A2N5UBF7_9BASI|nr:hypothetical protein PCANC_17629 [Puccinia coronata f. sp. avenae]
MDAARPKGVRTPPERLKKKACGGCTPSQPGVQTPARPPPHAACRPHAYKWREDSRLGVRPRRTGVLAMHACPEGVQGLNACPEGVQGLHALQKGVHGQHACPAGPHAEPAVLTPFVGVRTACGTRGFARLCGKACSPRTPFF